ncbi:hypothetical protein [Paenibacillus sp. PK1-4R]|uniref:trypsin-like serine peptidase n=1 Tax=Paenibacillus sp. PK1-4R TaxID=3049075 RepID=UPI0025A03BA6|nr:hypothetical protein [Paenibacillus sp. PK1-4R]WJM05864.1 hypothetical protein QNO02_16405 [Paenibacillus sp. PK1-4R]
MISLSEEEYVKVLAYWTPERKLKAIPISPPAYNSSDFQVEDKNRENDDCSIIPSNNSNMNFNLQMLGTAFPADVAQFPYHVGGKFFFTATLPDGTKEDRTGSAQFVGHCSIILTAGHCVRNSEDGQYYTNLLFSRGYDNASGDDYSITRVETPDNFVGSTGTRRRSFDYAFAFTHKPFNDWIGLQINNPSNSFRSIGYPFNYEEGKKMYAVDGTKGDVRGNVVEMKGNPFGPGASGGAWIANYSTERNGLSNLVVGLNGGYALDGSDNWYSPLFVRETIDLFNKIQNNARC